MLILNFSAYFFLLNVLLNYSNEVNIKQNDIKVIGIDGFSFSGSGLVIDILRHNGCVLIRNIRLDEFVDSKDNFSWPIAIRYGYKSSERSRIILDLLKRILIRIPLNLIQKTILYNFYLRRVGRGIEMHEPGSVNRSVLSYFLSIYMLLFKKSYDEGEFKKWFYYKYYFQFKYNKNLLLDNGIPRDKKIAKWFFNLSGSMGIYVYREPRIQYQQIVQVYSARGMVCQSYLEFLKILQVQYNSINWMLKKNHDILFISFDQLILKSEYYKILKNHLQRKGICKKMIYDLQPSKRNNALLTKLAKKIEVDNESKSIELIISKYHSNFQKHFNKMIKLS